jgi:hypothetical protein
VDGEFALGVVVFGLAVTLPAFGVVLGFRFLAALARALRRVHPDRRRMDPRRVWFNLVPIFNFVWAPATVVLVAESLRNEYRSRGLDRPGEDYGRFAGLTLLTLLATGCLFYPAILTYPAAVVVWVRYWLAVNRYAGELGAGEHEDARAAAEADEGW